MRNKLLIGTALLAAGIAVGSCEKTPSGQPGAAAQNQSGSQRSGAQKQADQSGSPTARGENEQGSKQAPRKAEQNRPNGGQGAQDRNDKATEGERQPTGGSAQGRATSQSETTAQSDREQRQGQSNQPQQSQVQQNEPQQNTQPQQNQPQQNQPQQNQQKGNGTAGRTVNLSREQIRQAQRTLKQKGFDVGAVDGIMGPATRKALIAFQQQQGLQASGQMDQRTVTALGIAPGPGHDGGAGSTTAGHGGASTP